MVIILYSSSEHVPHVWWKNVFYDSFFKIEQIKLPNSVEACAPYSELPVPVSTMVQPVNHSVLLCFYLVPSSVAQISFMTTPRVLISVGNSEVGAHMKSNLCYLICLRYLIRSRAVLNRLIFSPKIPIFLHACVWCSELLSSIRSMITPKKR